MENLMQKQKAAIKQLEKEQTEVATEMKLAASSKNQKGSVKTAWFKCYIIYFNFFKQD